MPYNGERAHRLGHVPVVREALAARSATAGHTWKVLQNERDASQEVRQWCRPVLKLGGPETHVTTVAAVDGSNAELSLTQGYPVTRDCYIAVGFVILDWAAHESQRPALCIDGGKLHDSSSRTRFSFNLPSSGLVRGDCSDGLETWRSQLNEALIRKRQFFPDSSISFADALLLLHGESGAMTDHLVLGTCPTRGCVRDDQTLVVGMERSQCPQCGTELLLADALRTQLFYMPDGSNQTAMNTVMSTVERLVTVTLIEWFRHNNPAALNETLFITDGPLGVFNSSSHLNRRFSDYYESVSKWALGSGYSQPLWVGLEKGGVFADFAHRVREDIPRGSVLLLTRDMHNRIVGRDESNTYGVDNFYGRKFLYRTSAGDILTLTVPPKPGVRPYHGAGCDDWDSYPTLKSICAALDGMRCLEYPSSVVPVVQAHEVTSIPRNIGHETLRRESQLRYGLPIGLVNGDVSEDW